MHLGLHTHSWSCPFHLGMFEGLGKKSTCPGGIAVQSLQAGMSISKLQHLHGSGVATAPARVRKQLIMQPLDR